MKAEMTIRTNYDHPPIPTRNHDWSSWQDGTEEHGPIGRGATEAEAIANLKEQIDFRSASCLWCEQGSKPVHQLHDGRWIQPCTAVKRAVKCDFCGQSDCDCPYPMPCKPDDAPRP